MGEIRGMYSNRLRELSVTSTAKERLLSLPPELSFGSAKKKPWMRKDNADSAQTNTRATVAHRRSSDSWQPMVAEVCTSPKTEVIHWCRLV